MTYILRRKGGRLPLIRLSASALLYLAHSIAYGALCQELMFMVPEGNEQRANFIEEYLSHELKPEITATAQVAFSDMRQMVSEGNAHFIVIDAMEQRGFEELTGIDASEIEAVGLVNEAKLYIISTNTMSHVLQYDLVNIGDLFHKRLRTALSVGQGRSMTADVARDVLEAQAHVSWFNKRPCVDVEYFRCYNYDTRTQEEALLNGTIAAYFVWAEGHAQAVQQLADNGNLRLLEISPNVVNIMSQHYNPLYRQAQIDLRGYGGYGHVNTVGIPVAVMATENATDEDAEVVARTLYLENWSYEQDALREALSATERVIDFHPAAMGILVELGVSFD